MKRYLTALLIGVLSFGAIFYLLEGRSVKPSAMTIEIDATILKDDIFYVYYRPEGIRKWSNKHSVYRRVKGNKKPQILSFVLPIDKPIKRLRIDLGSNVDQAPMIITSVLIKSEVDQFLFGDNLLEYFDLNAYITYENEYFYPRPVSGRYDPFLISKSQVTELVEGIEQQGPLLPRNVIYLISFIFALAIGISFHYSSLSTDFTQLYIAIFILAILAPELVRGLALDKGLKNLEKRELTPIPEFKSMVDFPREFENYYNDNFGLRNFLITQSSKIKINLFKTSPKPELVQFGKNKFLFYNSYEDNIFKSYTNTNLLNRENLDKFKKRQLERMRKLDEKGIKYICGFWPNKHTIYQENLPLSMSLQIKGNHTLADQIISTFDGTELLFFDVRRDLLEAKDSEILYRKFDTHWNSSGAYQGYKSFCEQTNSVLGLKPKQLDEFDIKYIENNEGDLNNLLGIESIFNYTEKMPVYKLKDDNKAFRLVEDDKYPEGSLVTHKKNGVHDKKVLIFRDSFTTELIQFISLHFKEVVYVRGDYDQSLVNDLNPDIVISCRAERYLNAL